MGKISKILLIGVIVSLFLLIKPPLVHATIRVVQNPTPAYVNSASLRLTFSSDQDSTFRVDDYYSFAVWQPGSNPNDNISYQGYIIKKPTNDKTFEIDSVIRVLTGSWKYQLWLGNGLRDLNESSLVFEGQYYIFPPSGSGGTGLPSLRMDSDTFQYNTTPNLYIVNAQPNQDYTVWFNNELTLLFTDKFDVSRITPGIDGSPTVTVPINVGSISKDKKTLCLTHGGTFAGVNSATGLTCDFNLSGITVQALPPPPNIPPKPIQSNPAGIPFADLKNCPICPPNYRWSFADNNCQNPNETSDYKDPTITDCSKEKACFAGYGCSALTKISPNITPVCLGGQCPTAVGTISTSPAGLVSFLFKLILGLSGGIALILIIVGAYQMMTSQGNPERLQGAKETITSAIVGLLFIIFSFLLLEIIGVDILKIPGLNR